MSGILHKDLRVFHIVSSDLLSAADHRMHCSVSIARLSVSVTLLTATFVRHFNWEAILHFHGENYYANAPQLFVMLILLSNVKAGVM